jgi:hypothetical protein
LAEQSISTKFQGDGVLFIGSASTLENRETAGKDPGSRHGLYSWLAGMFAFLSLFVRSPWFSLVVKKGALPFSLSFRPSSWNSSFV